MNRELSYAENKRLLRIRFKLDFHDTFDGERIPPEVFTIGEFRDFNCQKNDLVEILAPANTKTYKQAVYNGADAIYFGYGEFNARANGDNFTSIKEVVDFCHFYSVRAYLALNISFYNDEIKSVIEVIKEAEEANLDAFIITDLALIPLIRKYSTIAIHASTQLGAHNRWGMKFLHSFSINRAVLSREMQFKDIRATTDQEYLETEVFVHGALCSCFSGACLLSSMLTGNSANRGKCNQLCRMRYQAVVNGVPTEKGYLLSAKDICLDSYFDRLADIGVASLKIEGRLKRPEYVGGVTAYYADLKRKREPIYSKEDISVLFNRGGFTPGYFENNNVIYTGQPNHIGVYAGRVINVSADGKAYIKSENILDAENGYKVLRNQQEIGGAIATGEVKNGFSIVKSNAKLKVGDEIRLTNNKEISDFIANGVKRKTIPIKIRLAAYEKPFIQMTINNQKFLFSGREYVEPAQKQPLTEDEIFELFEGSHVREVRFSVSDIELYNAFLTKASLNTLRRDCLDAIWRFLLGFYDKTPKLFKELPLPTYMRNAENKIEGDFCEIKSLAQYKYVKKRIKNIVYSPSEYTYEDCERFYDSVKNTQNLVFIKIPIYVPTDKEEFFEDIIDIFDGVYANNIGAVWIANDMDKLIVCGPNLNITNTKSWFINNCCSYVVSTELSYAQVRAFKNPLVYTYGYLPLMHLNYCPRKIAGMQCGECEKELKFCDEKGEYYIETMKFDHYCEHVLHNGVLTDIGTKYNVRHYFDFTMTQPEEIEKIIAAYTGEKPYNPTQTNKLHLTRGAN